MPRVWVEQEEDGLLDKLEKLEQLQSDAGTLVMRGGRQRQGRVGLILGAVVAVALVGSAWLCMSKTRGNSGAQESWGSLKGPAEQKAETIEIVPSLPACSTWQDNCLSTGCCKVSGHKCFEKQPGEAHCNETCTPGKYGYTCAEPVQGKNVMPVVASPGTTMYCFSVYTANTGSTEKSYELDLLKTQLRFGAGLFGCNAWDIYSDAKVQLSPGPPLELWTIQVFDEFNEFHVVKRKETGSWVNWGLFFQVWKKIRDVGRWQYYDYTVKVDADAVFIPQRLVNWLKGKKVTEHGVYYENCQNVQLGFFGNLEVMSQKAAAVYTANLEDCHQAFAPCAFQGCDWEYGPWGEDVFAQRCMDRHHVEKVEAFDLTTDGACEADRPADQKKNKKWHPTNCAEVLTPAMHPFKNPKDFFTCLGSIMRTSYA